jgi:hypothetical protein
VYNIYAWLSHGWYLIESTTSLGFVYEGENAADCGYSVAAENANGEGELCEVVDPTVVPLTAADFSSLSFDDTKGDDYTLCMEGEGEDETVLDSWGRKGDVSHVDIRSVKTEFDEGTRRVTFDVTFDGALMYGASMAYMLCIVDGDHRQGDELLDPESVTEGLSWTYYNSSHVLAVFSVDEDFWSGEPEICASPSMPSLEYEFLSKSFTAEMDAVDLEAAGVGGGSGFGLYVYAHCLGTIPADWSDDNTWENKLTWDTAGTGAGTVPAEFNVEAAGGGDGDGIDTLLLIVVVAIVVSGGGAFAYSRSKRRMSGAAPPATTGDEQMGGSHPPTGPP